jgi:hypothetical protein
MGVNSRTVNFTGPLSVGIVDIPGQSERIVTRWMVLCEDRQSDCRMKQNAKGGCEPEGWVGKCRVQGVFSTPSGIRA